MVVKFGVNSSIAVFSLMITIQPPSAAPLEATGAKIDVHTHLLSADHLVSAYGAPTGSPASDAAD